MALRIRPIAPDYDPGYPRMIEVHDWRGLLERSSRRVFHPRTLAFAGLLGTSLLIPAPAAAAPEAEPAARPVPTALTAGNTKAAAIANKALDAMKGQANWRPRSSLSDLAYTPGNPALVVPQIPISFGNSMVGVFDLTRAKAVTADIFRAYGLDPQADYPLKREGIEFYVDGYDAKLGIGFEIVGGENPPVGFGGVPRPDREVSPAEMLDAGERTRLDKAIEGKSLTLFLAPARAYPNMDGDQFTPLAAYLRSVLDYLDWLKAQGRL